MYSDHDAPFERRQRPQHRLDRQAVDQIVDAARLTAAFASRHALERQRPLARTATLANVMHQLATDEERCESLERRATRRPVTFDGFDESDCADLL
jgi:hypothetical protein